MSETKKYPYTVEPNIIKLAPNYYRILIKKGSGKNQQVFSEYVSGKIGDARAVKRKGFAELENQKTKEKDKGKITLFEFSKEWLQFCRDTGLSPTTINGYKTRLNNYILPELGGYPLEKINAYVIDKLFVELKNRDKQTPNSDGEIEKLSSSSLNGAFRPGIVHRIDKDTWGLLLVAKNDKAHAYLAKQLENHLMHRSYLALVKGTFPNNKGEIDAPIGRDPSNRLRMKVKADGKKAISYYEVKKRFSHYTLLNLDLKTGRTHQLRAHLAFIDHPIVGDDLYGGRSSLYQNGQLLVAYKIVFKRPKDEKLMEFNIPLPKEFEEILLKLKAEDTSPII